MRFARSRNRCTSSAVAHRVPGGGALVFFFSATVAYILRATVPSFVPHLDQRAWQMVALKWPSKSPVPMQGFNMIVDRSFLS